MDLLRLRNDWINAINSPGSAGRFLYASGNTRLAPSSPITDPETENFLVRLSDRRPSLSLLARLYFLSQPGLLQFHREQLPELMRAMSHVAVSQTELSRRGIRGKVLWPQTIQARATGRADAATFYINRPERSPDTPENRLVSLFLRQVSGVISETERLVGTGALLGSTQEIRHHAEVALRSSYLSNVGHENSASALMHQRAQRHRNSRYGRVSDLQEQMDSAIRRNKLQSVAELLRGGWLAPLEDDDIFEVYTLITVMGVLEIDLGFGEPIEYGLIRGGRSGATMVAHFHRSDGVQAEMYFDQSPDIIFGGQSEYVSILQTYGLDIARRRPDITLMTKRPDNTERRLLIEVKRTGDLPYTRASLYRGLAYLRDFRYIWHALQAQSPKIILAFPEAVVPQPGVSEAGKDLVVLSAGDKPRWANFLSQIV